MESIKQGALHVKESAQQVMSGTSKEANKSVAKDKNAPIGTRYVVQQNVTPQRSASLTVSSSMSAAKDYVHDKADEHKHDAKAESHYQRM